MPSPETIEVGQRLPEQRETIELPRLVQYAGASGDLNPLHYQQEFAEQVSPTGGIIAHGMLSAGFVSRLVTEWAGGPEFVRKISTRFRAPCPLGATLVLGGEVTDVDRDGGVAQVSLWAELEDGSKVVDDRRSHAVVALS
jgi:acyl dehydratase